MKSKIDIDDPFYPSIDEDEIDTTIPTKKELKDKLTALLNEISRDYPNKRKLPDGFKQAIKRANQLLSKQKATIEELQDTNDNLEKQYSDLKKYDEQKVKDKLALEQANQERINKALAQENIDDDLLQKIAQMKPVNGKPNPVRPSWVKYDKEKKNYELNADLMADAIENVMHIKMLQDKGVDIGYINYNPMLGHWVTISQNSLGNFIDDAFKNPERYDDSSNNSNDKLYCRDFYTGRVYKDVLSLLKAKIRPIESKNTFDRQPKYIVHFQTFDFDVLNWKKVPFNPKNYFLYAIRCDPAIDTPEGSAISANLKAGKPENIKMAQKVVDTLANNIQMWFIQSLKDKETAKCFFERLGLSMLHTYEDAFFAFVKSTGGQGKSTMNNFLEDNIFDDDAVSNLDADLLIKSGSFDAQELRYKDVNFSGELRANYISNYAINKIKSLTGNDKADVPQKFKKTANFRNHAQLFFNTNHLPKFETYDDAVARRCDIFIWHYIPDFTHKFPMSKLKADVPEFLVVLMFYAHQVLNRSKEYIDKQPYHSRLSRSKQMKDAYTNWSDVNDVTGNFLKEECTMGIDFSIGTRYLLKALNKYLKDVDPYARAVQMADLTDKLAGYHIYKSQSKSTWYEYCTDKDNKKHAGVYVFRGITLNKFAKTNEEDNFFKLEQKKKGEARNPLNLK